MKLWFAGCAVLSGLLLSTLLFSMNSCTEDYEIDPQGALVRVSIVQQEEGKPARVSRRPAAWETELPGFVRVASRTRPGDKLVYTRTTVGLPPYSLAKTELKVLRDGAEVLVARHGQVFFWAATAGISALPLVIWGAGALWLLSSRPRKPAPP